MVPYIKETELYTNLLGLWSAWTPIKCEIKQPNKYFGVAYLQKCFCDDLVGLINIITFPKDFRN